MVLQGLKRQCTGSNNGSFKSTKWTIRKSTSIRAYICCVPDNEIHLLASVLESFDECKDHIVVYVIKGCNGYQRPTFFYRKLVNFLVILKSNSLKEEEPTFVNFIYSIPIGFYQARVSLVSSKCSFRH